MGSCFCHSSRARPCAGARQSLQILQSFSQEVRLPSRLSLLIKPKCIKENYQWKILAKKVTPVGGLCYCMPCLTRLSLVFFISSTTNLADSFSFPHHGLPFGWMVSRKPVSLTTRLAVLPDFGTIIA